jgi:HSP20 family protein
LLSWFPLKPLALFDNLTLKSYMYHDTNEICFKKEILMFTLVHRIPRIEFAALDCGLDNMLASFFDDQDLAETRLNQFDNPSQTEVFSKDNYLVYRVAMPGIDQKDINLSVENNVLKITAERKQPSEVQEEDWYAKSFRYGHFEQSWTLPKTVNPDEVSAEFKNGILEIRVARAKAAISKKIEVKQLESAAA